MTGNIAKCAEFYAYDFKFNIINKKKKKRKQQDL